MCGTSQCNEVKKKTILNGMNICFSFALLRSVSSEFLNRPYKSTSLSQIAARDHVLFAYCVLVSLFVYLHLFTFCAYQRIVKWTNVLFVHHFIDTNDTHMTHTSITVRIHTKFVLRTPKLSMQLVLSIDSESSAEFV